MLPYTPLHHILLRDVGRPLVMTSGNLSEEPIAQDNEEAGHRLAPLVDALLMHNRDIYARYDDSVWFAPTAHSVQPIRRSRGYAPFPVRLPFKAGQLLATGAELKNSFCVTRDDFAFLSQHIGDMENLETLEHFETTIELYKHLFRTEPEQIAHDLHPDYLGTRYAQAAFADPDARVSIQHHHAHVAACLVDNEWSPGDGPVIGVAWDGTGYGLDGHIWGGEFFVGGYDGFQRVAHLEYLPMPGGDAAIRNPWRLALGYAYTLSGEVPSLAGVSEQEARVVQQQVDRRLNTPLTSAAGRLFDAVAALVGVRERVTYEAQAAIELEMLATQWSSSQPPGDGLPAYPFDVGEEGGVAVIRVRPLFQAIEAARRAGASSGEMAWRFHKTMAAIIVAMCQRIAAETSLQTAALSGGCFQNRLLLALAVPDLERAGFRVLLHQQVPCNDGGVSLGQAALAHSAALDAKSAHEVH
jgi:hydrogenase maturation protein HypF